MDKIWYRNPSKSEVIDHCGRNEKTEWPRRTDKSRSLKKTKTKKTYPWKIVFKIVDFSAYLGVATQTFP